MYRYNDNISFTIVLIILGVLGYIFMSGFFEVDIPETNGGLAIEPDGSAKVLESGTHWRESTGTQIIEYSRQGNLMYNSQMSLTKDNRSVVVCCDVFYDVALDSSSYNYIVNLGLMNGGQENRRISSNGVDDAIKSYLYDNLNNLVKIKLLQFNYEDIGGYQSQLINELQRDLVNASMAVGVKNVVISNVRLS